MNIGPFGSLKGESGGLAVFKMGGGKQLERSEEQFSAMHSRFLAYIRKMTLSFPSQHREDLVQEGLWGLYCACRTYDAGRNVPFDAYAKVCVRRALLTAYRKLSRDDDLLLLENPESCLPENELALDTEVAERVDLKAVFSEFREALSPLEYRVLVLYLNENSYAQIAQKLSVSEKTVDNAMVRIRRKMKQRLT